MRGSRVLRHSRDGRVGQDGVAVLAPRLTGVPRVEVQVRAVHDVHGQFPRQIRGLVGEVAALTPVPVDLLQARDVGAGVPDVGRDAGEI